MFAALLVVIGLFCRISSAVIWLLYLSTAKSAELLSYGVDNFTIIGLFYLTIAPLPDSMALDAHWRGIAYRQRHTARLTPKGFAASHVYHLFLWWNLKMCRARLVEWCQFMACPNPRALRDRAAGNFDSRIIHSYADWNSGLRNGSDLRDFHLAAQDAFSLVCGSAGNACRDRSIDGHVPVCQR